MQNSVIDAIKTRLAQATGLTSVFGPERYLEMNSKTDFLQLKIHPLEYPVAILNLTTEDISPMGTAGTSFRYQYPGEIILIVKSATIAGAVSSGFSLSSDTGGIKKTLLNGIAPRTAGGDPIRITLQPSDGKLFNKDLDENIYFIVFIPFTAEVYK